MKTLFITTALALFAAPAIAETKWQWGCEWQQASNGNYWFRVDAGCDFPGAARAGTPPGGGHSQGDWLGDLLPSASAPDEPSEPEEPVAEAPTKPDHGGHKPGKGKGKGRG